MTREQAVQALANHPLNSHHGAQLFVDNLATLGVLKLDPSGDSLAAIDTIVDQLVWIRGGADSSAWQNHGALTVPSAQDIIGKLLKAGFKITR